MTFFRFLFCTIFVSIFFYQNDTLLAQLTAEEVYLLDVSANAAQGSSEHVQAAYFINMGMKELEALQIRERREGALSEEIALKKQELEIALAPVLNAIEGMMQSHGNQAEDMLLLQKTMHDTGRYKRVFEIIGSQRATELALERSARAILSKSKTASLDSVTPASPLNNEVVVKLLGMSQDQKNRFEKTLEGFKEKLEFGSGKISKQLAELLDKHWEQLLANLNSDQQSAARDLIGKPAQWFRAANEPHIRGRDFSISGEVVTSGGFDKSIRTKDGRTVYQMTPDELKIHGVDFMHSHLYEMINSTFIWEAVEMTKEQRVDIKSCDLRNTVALPNRHVDRLQELLYDDVDYPELIKSILIEDQLVWFRQLELQVLTGKFESSVGLLHPAVIERLKISSIQVGKLAKLADAYTRNTKKLLDVLDRERETIRANFDEATQEILSDKQRTLLRKIMRGRAEGLSTSTGE